MIGVRFAKAILVAACALYMSMIVLNNVTDYATNFAFVQHVLTMDTTVPGNGLMWRAVHSPLLHHAAYVSLIGWEALSAVLLWRGALKLFQARGASDFAAHKGPAVTGLVVSMLLWFVGFTCVGGEWWMMWESSSWNGMDPAARMFISQGVVLLFVTQAE